MMPRTRHTNAITSRPRVTLRTIIIRNTSNPAYFAVSLKTRTAHRMITHVILNMKVKRRHPNLGLQVATTRHSVHGITPSVQARRRIPRTRLKYKINISKQRNRPKAVLADLKTQAVAIQAPSPPDTHYATSSTDTDSHGSSSRVSKTASEQSQALPTA